MEQIQFTEPNMSQKQFRLIPNEDVEKKVKQVNDPDIHLDDFQFMQYPSAFCCYDK